MRMKRMNHSLIRVALAAALALTSIAAFASSATASYHLNLIREVHEEGATGDYVVLQSTAVGENLVAGAKIISYDGGGAQFGNPVVLSNVGNGANNATILAGESSVAGADATAAGFNIVNNGSVCYVGADNGGVDCVSFGLPPMNPLPSPAGTPVALPGGALQPGQSIVRTISRGCPTALDAADDTNNSSADFALGTPLKRNNASPITEIPCLPGTTTPAPPCAGKASTIVGSNGNDTLRGTPAADVISGLGGNDRIKGLAGKDVICGGPGKDRLLGGKGKDKLLGQKGKDTLFGGPGKDKLKGGPGKDVQIQ
jgi:Ca2+-binding RTX toxin-like protein